MRDIFRNALCVTALSFLCACGGSGGRDASHIENESRAAVICGREQALQLASSEGLDSMEMEKILIDVRVRESALRAEGEDALADSYIGSFLATLDSVNPALRSEIGGVDCPR